MNTWRGTKVVVVGAARQGLALARYFLIQGAQVVINDKRPPEQLAQAIQFMTDLEKQGAPLNWELGGHPLSVLNEAQLVCLSGGVPPSLPIVLAAREKGIPVSNDSQIFLERVPCKVIGITGSAGKTTTTTLVGRIAEAAIQSGALIPFKKAWVGGNIGSPLISALQEMSTDDLAIMELSSFQLELMSLSPQVAVILNITPNHLDRHATMEAYTAAKSRILLFQDANDIAILGRDDPGAWSLRSEIRGRTLSFGISELPEKGSGIYLDGDSIELLRKGNEHSKHILRKEDIALRGAHNLLNVMAACTIATAVGLPTTAIREGVKGFLGVSHRLEFVRSWGGAAWYDDSIATAPERALAAIQSFNEPLVLLAGGRDKDLPWDEFGYQVRRRVDHLVLFGEAAEKIQAAMKMNASERLTITRCTNLYDAVQAAAKLVNPGDVVLLSPGGTSFDEFVDFEQRGEYFSKWVKELP